MIVTARYVLRIKDFAVHVCVLYALNLTVLAILVVGLGVMFVLTGAMPLVALKGIL